MGIEEERRLRYTYKHNHRKEMEERRLNHQDKKHFPMGEEFFLSCKIIEPAVKKNSTN